MRRLFIVPLLIALAALIGSIVLEGVSLGIYLGLTPFMCSLLVSFVLLLTQFRLKEMAESFSYSRSKMPFDKQKIQRGILFFESMQKYLIISGVLGVFVGIVIILNYLSVDVADLCRRCGIALLTLFYSFFGVLMVSAPFETALKKRLAENE